MTHPPAVLPGTTRADQIWLMTVYSKNEASRLNGQQNKALKLALEAELRTVNGRSSRNAARCYRSDSVTASVTRSCFLPRAVRTPNGFLPSIFPVTSTRI